MENNKILNFVYAQNNYFEAIRQEIKTWEDDLLANELKAFEKLWEDDTLKDSYFLGDTQLEQILIEEAVERFKASATTQKGE